MDNETKQKQIQQLHEASNAFEKISVLLKRAATHVQDNDDEKLDEITTLMEKEFGKLESLTPIADLSRKRYTRGEVEEALGLDEEPEVEVATPDEQADRDELLKGPPPETMHGAEVTETTPEQRDAASLPESAPVIAPIPVETPKPADESTPEPTTTKSTPETKSKKEKK